MAEMFSGRVLTGGYVNGDVKTVWTTEVKIINCTREFVNAFGITLGNLPGGYKRSVVIHVLLLYRGSRMPSTLVDP